MRNLAAALVLTGLCSAAQTRAAGAVTAGADYVPRTGSAAAIAALQIGVDRHFDAILTASATLVGQLIGGQTFRDLGSSLRVNARPPSWQNDEGVFLELIPFNSERVRTTFEAANSWGSPIRARTVAPVVKVGGLRGRFDGWGALRAYSLLDEFKGDLFVAWSGWLGLGAALPGGFRAELAGSVQDRGVVPGLANQGIRAPVVAMGASARLSWQRHGGVRAPLDPASLANDPARYERTFAPEHYDPATAAWIGLEGGVASQSLENPNIFAQVRSQAAGYLDLQVRLRLASLRLFATGRVRSLTLIPFDAVGFPPYRDFPDGTKRQDELSTLIGFDYHFAALGLTPGLLVRTVRPASFKPPGPAAGLSGSRVVILGEAYQATILPTGREAQVSFGGQAYQRFERFEPLSAILLVSYLHDPNSSIFRDSINGALEPEAITIDTVGLSLQVQARF